MYEKQQRRRWFSLLSLLIHTFAGYKKTWKCGRVTNVLPFLGTVSSFQVSITQASPTGQVFVDWRVTICAVTLCPLRTFHHWTLITNYSIYDLTEHSSRHSLHLRAVSMESPFYSTRGLDLDYKCSSPMPPCLCGWCTRPTQLLFLKPVINHPQSAVEFDCVVLSFWWGTDTEKHCAWSLFLDWK